MLKIFDLESNQFFDKEYTSDDICAICFNNCNFTPGTEFKNVKYFKIKEIIAWLSFHQNDKFITTWDGKYTEAGGYVKYEIKTPKKFRIYDDDGRIISPHLIRGFLEKFDEEVYQRNLYKGRHHRWVPTQPEPKEVRATPRFDSKTWKGFRAGRKEAVNLKRNGE